MKNLGQVYLDDQEPVWTPDEILRRDAFNAKFIGRIDNWLGYKSGVKLAGKLDELRKKYEASPFSSQIDMDPELLKFGRKDPGWDMGSMGRAISRATLAEAMPWLIPELYNAKNINSLPIENWIGNLEAFVANYEAELTIIVGERAGQPIPGDPLEGDAYRDWIKFLIEASSVRNANDSLTVSMLADHGPDNQNYHVQLRRHQYPDDGLPDGTGR